VLSQFDSFRFTVNMAKRPYMLNPAFQPDAAFLMPLPRHVEGSSSNWSSVVQVANESSALTATTPEQSMVANAASGVLFGLIDAVNGVATFGRTAIIEIYKFGALNS